MNFLVTVLCAAHIRACPIPDGYKKEITLPNKQECVKQAKTVIATLGYATADFRIDCKAK